jgi:N-acetylneuraminic acid mutarotase
MPTELEVGVVNSGTTFYKYDPELNTWTTYGPYSGSGNNDSVAEAVAGVCYFGTGGTGLYDDGRWKSWTLATPAAPATLTAFPGFREGCSSFVINGLVYVGLGFYDRDWVYYKDWYKYTPATDAWVGIGTPGAAFSARRSAIGFAIGANGYVVGGSTTIPNVRYSDCWRYSSAGDSWSQMASYPTNIEQACVFVIDGIAYIVGGFVDGTRVATCYKYTPSTNAWIAIADFGGGAISNSFAFAANGKGYVGAGVNGAGTGMTDTWCYDPDDNDWTQVADFTGIAGANKLGVTVGSSIYSFPEAEAVRVTGLRHYYTPGAYRLELNLGGMSTTEDLSKYEKIVPKPGDPTGPETTIPSPPPDYMLPHPRTPDDRTPIEKVLEYAPYTPPVPNVAPTQQRVSDNVTAMQPFQGNLTGPGTKWNVWRATLQQLTPWNEKAGETYGAYWQKKMIQPVANMWNRWFGRK